MDICPRIALLEHGVIIRDIDNTDGSAEKELEDYFNIGVKEEELEEEQEETGQPQDAQTSETAQPQTEGEA